MIEWQFYLLAFLLLIVGWTAWREAHPLPPEPPDYLSAFHYYIYAK